MKFVALVSSGIDSPVATYLLSKKADGIVLVHADNRPFTDDREIENFFCLAKKLKKLCSCDMKAFVIPHGASLGCFKESCNQRFTCVFCKRMMLRYAEQIAKMEHAGAIVMGDSLGQVASQTLQNIRVIEQAIGLPVLRPLIGLDKEDVIQIAKKIGTFDLSVVRSAGCSAVPVKPSTKAALDQIVFEESQVDVEGLVRRAVENVKAVKF